MKSTTSTVTDRRRILFGARADDEVAERWAADLEAAGADGVEVSAAGDEGDVVPGMRQPRPVVAADRARAHDGKSHELRYLACAPELRKREARTYTYGGGAGVTAGRGICLCFCHPAQHNPPRTPNRHS